MRQKKYLKITILSSLIGTLMVLSIFLERIIPDYDEINDIILLIPRETADIFFDCWWCKEQFIFIGIFTFLFYALLTLLVFYLIKKIRGKK